MVYSSVLVLFASLLFFSSSSLLAQPSYENYQLVWSDEFDTDGLPDASNWGYEQGCSIRNSELQYYARAREENSRVEDDHLIIEARRENMDGCDYTAASLITRGKREFMYGIFEMRAKIDVRRGSWPAFWTLGITEEWPSNGEVDIMEYYNGSLHANVAWGTDTRWEGAWDSQTRSVGSDFSDDFHIWRMHWTEEFIDLWVDDFRQNTTDLSTTINGSLATLRNPFHQKAYILVNQAIGANGGDPSGTAFPIQYVIDYVRVYQEGADTIAPTIQTVSGNAGGTVVVLYSEGIDKTAAAALDHYAITTPGITITSARLQSDGKTVLLSVEGLTVGDSHELTVSSIPDDAVPANTMTEITLAFTVAPESVPLTGILIGNGTPYENNPDVSYDKALDGSTTTFSDCTGDVVWTGYDFGDDATVIITGFRYYPRPEYAERMNGKSFEISTDGSTWEKVYTITSPPPEREFTTVLIPATKPVRFVRYNGSGGYLNVNEVEFWGYDTTETGTIPFTGKHLRRRNSGVLLASPMEVTVTTLDGKIILRQRFPHTGPSINMARINSMIAHHLRAHSGVVVVTLQNRHGTHIHYRTLTGGP